MNIAVNDVIGGYRIVRQLGEGGVGAVFEVEHIKLGVHYALKAFIFDGRDADQLRRRFEAEGKTLARLNHPNLVRVIDLDVDEAHGVQYFVMDLVLTASGEAKTLADVEPGSVDENQLLDWFGELCDALDYVHDKGVIHRDVKLNNILISSDGHAVLSDFGISRIIDPGLRAAIDIKKTTSHINGGRFVMGTAGYMAPELYSGADATKESDVFALGVCFFKLLTNVWYDPSLAPRDGRHNISGIDSVRLLEMFEKDWFEVLPAMMDSDPGKRPTDLRRLFSRVDASWSRLKIFEFRRLSGVILAAILAVCCLVGYYIYENSNSDDMLDFDRAFRFDGVLEGEM